MPELMKTNYMYTCMYVSEGSMIFIPYFFESIWNLPCDFFHNRLWYGCWCTIHMNSNTLRSILWNWRQESGHARTCRRTQQLTYFNALPTTDYTKCCDVCSGLDEKADLFHPSVQSVSDSALVDDRFVTPEQRALIREKLTELHSRMLFSTVQSNIPLYTGLDLVTGLPTSLIDAIVDNYHKITVRLI